jgi:hypothetical protein
LTHAIRHTWYKLNRIDCIPRSIKHYNILGAPGTRACLACQVRSLSDLAMKCNYTEFECLLRNIINFNTTCARYASLAYQARATQDIAMKRNCTRRVGLTQARATSSLLMKSKAYLYRTCACNEILQRATPSAPGTRAWHTVFQARAISA